MMGTQHKMVGVGFGLASALYIAEAMNQPGPAIIALATSTVGCMLPDIDHDMTKIGRKRKVITKLTSGMLTTLVVVGIVLIAAIVVAITIGMMSANTNMTTLLVGLCGIVGFGILYKILRNTDTVKWMCHHRGFMHTLMPLLLIVIMMFASDMDYWFYGWLGLGIGYASHLLADMLTVEGCPILWPASRASIRILKLKTKNKSTWIAALLLAALPCVVVFYLVRGI